MCSPGTDGREVLGTASTPSSSRVSLEEREDEVREGSRAGLLEAATSLRGSARDGFGAHEREK
ncbi:hypothetical protein AGABI2DRAFT_194504, partial [Agaricus bisporus var. bisporus H97]|uniref:hypothetical protein n=1 Tax=Agaricus bisporus var. bisporus (strain H97 / ATCC MYA-4626 / FGSC 10389) TaxID=936046 RepID=UPI00029F6BB2